MTRKESFDFFLKYFAQEALPVTFSEDIIRHFSEGNPPLDADSIRRYIAGSESEEELDEEMTEYIACCQIPDTQDFKAVVYWKGSLLSYEYILATYSNNGVLINKKVIAGIKSDGNNVHTSVATIEEDWSIQIVVGYQEGDDLLYDPKQSQTMAMDLLPSGAIVLMEDEE